jgi:hypothetical protein
LARRADRSFPEVAGVEDAAVVLAAVVVLGAVDGVGAVEVVAAADDAAGVEEIVVALVVVTAGDEVAVVVVLPPFPPHPMPRVATIARVKEITNTFFKLHPSSPVFGFPFEVGNTDIKHCNTLRRSQ